VNTSGKSGHQIRANFGHPQQDCEDNGPAESFFSTLKAELHGHRAFRSHDGARTAVFEYMAAFYAGSGCTPALDTAVRLNTSAIAPVIWREKGRRAEETEDHAHGGPW
jgi:hypothetical protein